ncbi:lipid-binding SYLF domain-containing protein [Robertkochia solimangrovi]|uniref:lipid-binding SYLF domain-containing protein n=1 Tax=Robertkochia solimangrovi TaxID=2213046 RepID=UPI00117DDB7D|nr:lipid-binding SYLF domain-containing protein [Robertkochia solimangrovi]TRZ41255.1 hypothetical protein DMZ48_17640 [Robertkochia solimangrovi]
MKYLVKSIIVLMIMAGVTHSMNAQSEKDQKIIADSEAAVKTLLKVNPEIRSYFDKSAGCVVFPNVGKGGFIVGGAAGRGVLYQYGQKKGIASMKEFNFGLELGGQALIEVIFFEKLEDVEDFKKGKFQFDAGVSAAALESGKSYNAKYKDGVAVFTHTKSGMMAEASVGGQKFSYKEF